MFGEISELMSSQEEPFGNSNVSFLIITVKMRDRKVERRERVGKRSNYFRTRMSLALENVECFSKFFEKFLGSESTGEEVSEGIFQRLVQKNHLTPQGMFFPRRMPS